MKQSKNLMNFLIGAMISIGFITIAGTCNGCVGDWNPSTGTWTVDSSGCTTLAYNGVAYQHSCLAALMPEAGKCRELTDEEIEQVANDEQPGHGYWQTWDVIVPDEGE